MSREPLRRSSQVQGDKPAEPAARSPEPATRPLTPSGAVPRLSLGWHLVLFFWVTSFAFLLLYEVLASVARAVTRHG